ncbi:MAG: DinB family protein [Gemmataceae bacterium]|nr:DinB family protein [Gemmataceae bacterium]
MDTPIHLGAFVVDYLKKLADGIPDDLLDDQAAPGMHSPRWLLGHLAMAQAYGVVLLGGKPASPKEWMKAFGPGSEPTSKPDPAPSKEEILAVIEKDHAALVALIRSATPEKLAGPHGFGPMEKHAPTMADFIAHLMTTHAASHLGQLSAWRRLRGLPAVLGF